VFKKVIKFEDFNGNEQTQEFYFHLSKAELLAMAADGNAMMARIQRIIDSKDGRAILNEFRELIKEAAGVRSEDGSRFIKTPEAKSVLMDSPAFDELLMELATDAEASAKFVRQLIPQKMQDEMHKKLREGAPNQQPTPGPDPFAETEDPRPAWMKEHRNPTQQELMNMGLDEMRLAFQHRK
jgi:hypothetical protein